MPVPVANGAYARVVLVAEDEFLVRCNIAEYLRDAGFVVLETDSGEEAIALCKLGMSIDVLFTDINLAGSASGWDVAENLRTKRPDVAVFYTSGSFVDQRLCVPGSLFVPKPYRASEILDAFQRTLMLEERKATDARHDI
jgi:CheY-like chemotaxis protein